MTPSRRLLAILALLFGANFSRTEAGLWGIDLSEWQSHSAKSKSEAAQNDDQCGIFDESLEKTADRLYREAVEMEKDGQVERAAEKFITLLEQCPSYYRRDEIVQRLSNIAKLWLDDLPETKQVFQEEAQKFVIPTRASPGREERKNREAQARKMLVTLQQLAFRKIIDSDTFIWDRKLHEIRSGWAWLEDILLEVDPIDAPKPVPGAAVGIWGSGEESPPAPTQPSRRWFSSPWRQQIMLQLALEGECTPNPTTAEPWLRFGFTR